MNDVLASTSPDGLEVPACCPGCGTALVWEVNIGVHREIAWAHPRGPIFPFDCPVCANRVEISFDWRLERGSDPRHLQLVVGRVRQDPADRCLLLVDRCPHGCGTKLALQLRPEDPFFRGRAWPDEVATLGGYRCPVCDGEGRLLLRPVVAPATP